MTMPENKMEMVSFYKTMEVDMDNAIVVKVTTISRERKQVSSCKCTICLRIGMIKKPPSIVHKRPLTAGERHLLPQRIQRYVWISVKIIRIVRVRKY